jgi:hypothetical protein
MGTVARCLCLHGHSIGSRRGTRAAGEVACCAGKLQEMIKLWLRSRGSATGNSWTKPHAAF